MVIIETDASIASAIWGLIKSSNFMAGELGIVSSITVSRLSVPDYCANTTVSVAWLWSLNEIGLCPSPVCIR
jgi:hypothetical protein